MSPDFTGGFAETWGRASACRAIIRGVPRARVSHRHGKICHCRIGGYQVTAGTHGTGEKYDKNNRAMDCEWMYKLNSARVRILRRTVFVCKIDLIVTPNEAHQRIGFLSRVNQI